MDQTNIEITLLHMSAVEIDRYQKEFINKFGSSCTLQNIRISYPELGFMEDDELELIIEAAVNKYTKKRFI